MTTECGTNVCPKCKGSGWMYVDFEANLMTECDCGLRQRQIQENKLRFAAIPKTYKDVRLKDITARFYVQENSKNIIKAASKDVKNYLDKLFEHIEEGRGLYFWSETKGSGKTMMAAALANELINEYHRYVKFATSLEILDEIRNTYNRNSEDTESKLLKDLVTSEFLIIDDFGTERATDWAGEKFYQIVNKRYVNKKVTIFTSNYNLTTLRYDDRITNRIRERCWIIHFPEESVREYKARLYEKKG